MVTSNRMRLLIGVSAIAIFAAAAAPVFIAALATIYVRFSHDAAAPQRQVAIESRTAIGN